MSNLYDPGSAGGTNGGGNLYYDIKPDQTLTWSNNPPIAYGAQNSYGKKNII